MQGDSGGSVIYKTRGGSYETVGVVSWGIQGCQSGKPSVMARVTVFLDWINQEISDSALCPREPVPSPSTHEPSSCLTVSGAQPGVECVFPFSVANITLAGCTRIDGDQTAWCATAVDDQVNGHEKSYILCQHQGIMTSWGYCPESGCPIHSV